jgi:curved DNA-binding protein CbpA
MSKDYYKILGVQEDADELVIRASYLALLKRYNLDDWKGNDKQQAIKMLADINEAYSVLKDRYERLEYNASRINRQLEVDEPAQVNMTVEEIDAAWLVACNYYSDLERLYSNLHKISEQVANSFKLSILGSKDYSSRNKLAAKFELEYLKSRFGSDQDLIDFGKELILEEAKDAVVELEHVFKVMGNAVNADEVISKISEKYRTQRYIEMLKQQELERIERQAEYQQRQLRLKQQAEKEIEEKEKAQKSFWIFILIVIAITIFTLWLTSYLKPVNGADRVVSEKVSSSIPSKFLFSKDSAATVCKENLKNPEVLEDLNRCIQGLTDSNQKLDSTEGVFLGVDAGYEVSMKIKKSIGRYWVELVTANERCLGSVSGLLVGDKNNFQFIKVDKDSPHEICRIDISNLREYRIYSVQESNCSLWHGAACAFSATSLSRVD